MKKTSLALNELNTNMQHNTFNVKTNRYCSYQNVPRASLSSAAGAVGRAAPLDPQGLVLAAAPTPAASLHWGNVSWFWVTEPRQWNISAQAFQMKARELKHPYWTLSRLHLYAYLPTCAMMILRWGHQRFRLSLDLVQPAVQLPFVSWGQLTLQGSDKYFTYRSTSVSLYRYT